MGNETMMLSRRELIALAAATGSTAVAIPEAVSAATTDAGTLTIARSSDSVSLDPTLATAAPSVWVFSNIFETLVREDRDLSIRPALAESWEVAGPSTWRFHLRKGVEFHDGTPFDAAAVKFTFDRALNPKAPARGLSMAGPISEATVVDPYTVDISTRHAFGPTLQSLSEVFVFGIVSPSAVQKYGEDFGHHPVGTGPFRFVSWTENSQIILQRNDRYWDQKPAITNLIFRVIPDPNSQVLAFKAKEIDGILSPDANAIAVLRREPSATVYEIPGLRMLYVGFNTQRPVFSDVRVRQAFNHAIDTHAIAERLLRGTATPATGYLPKQTFGYFDAGTYDYNPAKAKQLLAQAGWVPAAGGRLQKNGADLLVNFWGYTGRDPNSRLIAEAIQGELAEIGVDVRLRIWDYAQLSSALWQNTPKSGPAATGYDMFMLGWTTITGDADFTLYGNISDISEPPNGLNATFWAPPAYMDALKAGRFSTNQLARRAAYKTAQQMLHAAAIWCPLVVLDEVTVFSNRVKGYAPNPVEYYMALMNGVTVNPA